jgi:hypothetical protein
MINSVMINEEKKVDKRSPLPHPPSLPRPLHTTQGELFWY